MGTVPIAGYCHECGAWIHVTTDWSCPKGHAAAVVNGWYDTESGAQVAPPPSTGPITERRVSREATRPVSASGTRTGFLIDLMAVFAHSRAYTAGWGSDTDLAIASNPVDGMWGTGSTRAEYAAALKVAEVDRVVHFWEMLKEHTGGVLMESVGTETYAPVETGDPGAAKKTAAGSGSTSWEWGYGTTRKVVEEVAARHGFTLRPVLTRDAAVW